jgi:hypothetical protein
MQVADQASEKREYGGFASDISSTSSSVKILQHHLEIKAK